MKPFKPPASLGKLDRSGVERDSTQGTRFQDLHLGGNQAQGKQLLSLKIIEFKGV